MHAWQEEAGAYGYESFGDRQRVRLDGRVVGYVRRVAARRWLALRTDLVPVGTATRRRDATALLAVGSGAGVGTPD